jgi:hypothetical protein
MTNIECYKELINKLTERIAQLEEENDVLRIELSNCNGKVNVLNQFYTDFKHLYGTDSVVSKTSVIAEPNSQTKTYDTLLAEYFVTKEQDIVKHLFEDYNISPSQILTDIRESLPENIEELVKKYNCENEYKIILRSLEYIKKFKLSPGKSLAYLINKYIDSFNAHKKKIALNYLVQALKFFPLQFDKFLNDIAQYRYDGLDEYIAKQRAKLYEEKRPRGRPSKKNLETIVKKRKYLKCVINKEYSKRGRKPIDYSIPTVDELIKIIHDTERNKRQKALRTISGMKKAGRTEAECELFKQETNNILDKKI